MKLFYTFITVCFLFFSQQVKAVEKIEVQALMPGMVVLLIDGTRTTLKTGGHSQGVKLISSTTQTAVLEVDGEKKNYQMGTTVSTSFRPREVITERVIIDNYGMFRSFGSINGHSVKFLVDTGASTVAMSAKDARSLGIQYQLEGTPTQASTASGLAKAWSVQLKTVRLGQLLERNVQGMVIDGDYPRHILLGMTFLNRMKVEKDGNTMSIISEK
ncbi:MAG: TIGR02281 family clan AA aspartic protease [Gammaproteobacteria bacterium]|nr:TIGR02281 family clan AA aspartic protease [Gammaproteobacteria bacterium]